MRHPPPKPDMGELKILNEKLTKRFQVEGSRFKVSGKKRLRATSGWPEPLNLEP
jgi:hypothetical protein